MVGDAAPVVSVPAPVPSEPTAAATPVAPASVGAIAAPASPAPALARDPPAPAPPVAARKVPAPVPFTVHVRPYAQRALLDGVEVATDEQRVVFSLGPGAHRLRIEHPCCEPFEREIDAGDPRRASGSSRSRWSLGPPASASPATPPPASSSTGGSSGRPPTRSASPSGFASPPTGANPYEGEVNLRLEAPGRRPAGATVRVRAGQEITVPAVLTEEPPR